MPIEGKLLKNIWEHRCSSKENYIREKGEDGETRAIKVKPGKLKGYSPEPKM